MKKIILIILTLFLFLINSSSEAAQTIVKKEYKVPISDGFLIRATMLSPKIKGQTEVKTVVLLHSLGYNSQWWGTLPNELTSKGYAVLTVDLRGHGESVYNKNLAKVSWKSMTKTAYAKCPDDVVSVIKYISEDNPKKEYFKYWALVGSDFGASVGIIAADKLSDKPKTIVMLSPIVKAKGLYIPISVAQLDNTDFLSITGINDIESKDAEKYIKKFAQAGFTEYVSEVNTNGILLIKNDSELSKIIAEWIGQYLSD